MTTIKMTTIKMRTKEEIDVDSEKIRRAGLGIGGVLLHDQLTLEILLDIRDLLANQKSS